MSTAPIVPPASFEEAFAELERVLRVLEDGKASLDEAIAAYERGTLLRQFCEEKLRDAQLRIDRITLNADGTPQSLTSTEE